MFPPKVIGVIGSMGEMARNVVIPLFRKAGCEVIGSDKKIGKVLRMKRWSGEPTWFTFPFSLFPKLRLKCAG